MTRNCVNVEAGEGETTVPLSAEAAALSTEPNLFQTQRQPKGDQN